MLFEVLQQRENIASYGSHNFYESRDVNIVTGENIASMSVSNCVMSRRGPCQSLYDVSVLLYDVTRYHDCLVCSRSHSLLHVFVCEQLLLSSNQTIATQLYE